MPCYRVCQYHSPPTDYNGMADMRAWWEKWDLRILILYILLTQLYLHFSGRMRRKSVSAFIIVNVWLLYLFSDMLATIALGKLSKLKVNSDAKEYLKQINDSFNPTTNTYSFPLPTPSSNVTMGKDALRVMWAPLILFYLGGPDTITVLRFEENKLWTRHLVGLGTQALRTAYALVATLFLPRSISYLALLLCIPGIIKYGERVWVVMSNSNDDYSGLVQLGPAKIVKSRALPRNAELVLLAHSWFVTLRPHAEDYECDPVKVEALVKEFRKEVRTGDDAFKLMEIELGLIYDMLFSKVSTIFTKWGSILRFLSFCFLISVLAVFLRTLTRGKLPVHFEGDDVITIILLAGAIFLDLAGIVVQLKSDWALVWACNNIDRIKWGATPVLFLHENLISDRQTWSGFMGQLSLREFSKNYKCNKMWESLFGKEKLLKRFSSQKKPDKHLKELIFRSLCEISEKRATSGVRRAKWILVRDDLAQQFKWSDELEFSQCIVIWHIATEVCYWSDPGNVDTKVRAVKMLSDYMMYLLVAYASRFPFCNIRDYGGKKNICDEIVEKHNLIKGLFSGGESLSYGQKGAEKKDNTIDTTLMEAQRLVEGMKENRNKWDIMGSVWVETLRHAAQESLMKQHIEELRRGGEFFTHFWLLLMHLGDSDKLESRNSSRVDEHDSAPEDSKDNKVAQKDEDSKDNKVAQKDDWDLTSFWGKTCSKISSP
ncbi:hypothetical protein RHMOL_Rhmol07G0053200 [Rhododendron molle]|uniref:Uncharacterized protein n=1 Tax=Rhododendron molle TaxID=49168 RepID=A0ACC0MYN1_RHOML|nr:hypothetical protein RHMOL_Rhmol07G0053200 [Rhododendron molle]